MPMMRATWVRPRSRSLVSAGLSSAIRQTTLLVPMSRIDSVALLREDSGRIRGHRFNRLPAGRAMVLGDSDEATYVQLINPLVADPITGRPTATQRGEFH